MKAKQFLWLLLALAVLAGTGWLGVLTAQRSQEAIASFTQMATEGLSSAVSGTRTGNYAFPMEPFVARVDVDGTIASSAASGLYGSGTYDHEGLLDYVDALTRDPDNVGILLYVDSPGGEMGASDELYFKLLDYKKATGRPIYCYFDQLACSGGYYVAMAADEIWANRNCTCVNIGVYISTLNMTGLFEKLGVEQVVFKSSENKGIGMSGVPWTEEQKDIYQSMVDEYYDQFLEVVSAGRGMSKATIKARDDGREMTAAQALKAEFIDGICRYEEYEDTVLARFPEAVMYEYSPSVSPLNELLWFINSAAPRSDTQMLLDFAESHRGMVVMAYADGW